MIIDPSVANNISKLEQLYADNNYFCFQNFESKQGRPLAAVAYLSVIINQQTLNKQFVRKINEDILAQEHPTGETILDSIRSLGIVTEIPSLDKVTGMIADAGIVIFVEGLSVCYGIGIPGYETRAVDQPTSEINVRGPREGFTEDLKVNMGLVYRRMKSTKLKSKIVVLGRESQTNVMIVYLEDQVEASVLREVEERIESVKLNIVVDSAQIEEWIQDSPYSPFPQIMNTERPDRVANALNLGKVVIFTDGSPNALIAPSTFTDFLHPSEDLYEKFYFANFLRLLRMLTLLISLCGPSLYIALTTFHLEMIPTPLMLTFLSTKSGIPFPTFLEALIMEVAFEILREASIRLPRTVGQSVSIVGALIIGEAAVQSGIISRPMVIVVAMTGIASFTIPAFNTAITLRLLRFPLIFIAAWTGVLGLALGLFAIVLHLCSLRSFGKLYLPTFNANRWKDVTEHYLLLPIKHRRQSKNDTSYATMEGQVSEHEDH